MCIFILIKVFAANLNMDLNVLKEYFLLHERGGLFLCYECPGVVTSLQGLE
jgi:hypothetical protein